MALDFDKIVTAENSAEEQVSSAKKELLIQLADAKEKSESMAREADESGKKSVAKAIESGRTEAIDKASKLSTAQRAVIDELRKSSEAKASKAIQAIIEVF